MLHKAIPSNLRNFSLALVVLGSALLGGCANQSLRDEADANSAATRGDWKHAEQFAEQAYLAYPSVNNKFNLANAYQATGQYAKASALYEMVVTEGNFTPTVPVAFADGSVDPNSVSPLSSEAARRLKMIAARSAPLAQSALLQ
jgi:hypothetical protein